MIKYIVNDKMYDLKTDPRFLIPFMDESRKYGMVNHEGVVVIKPEYDVILNDCYTSEMLVEVGKLYAYGFYEGGNRVRSYVNYKYGLIDTFGNIVLPVEYRNIMFSSDNRLLTLQSWDEPTHKYGVCDKNGNILIPFGEFCWIDGFDKGFARAKKGDMWGIINAKGEELLPFVYKKIWNFYGKDMLFTTVELMSGRKKVIYFHDFEPSLPYPSFKKSNVENYEYGDSREVELDKWDALTDGQYGDMPDDFDGDYNFMGY